MDELTSATRLSFVDGELDITRLPVGRAEIVAGLELIEMCDGDVIAAMDVVRVAAELRQVVVGTMSTPNQGGTDDSGSETED